MASRSMGSPEPDPGLRQLANESGGGYFELHEAEHLGPAFARFAEELHRQYQIGFTPPENDGVVHRIDVRVRGPQLMLGYRNHPQQTRSALRDGWLHTGDVGYLDEEGHLFLIEPVRASG